MFHSSLSTLQVIYPFIRTAQAVRMHVPRQSCTSRFDEAGRLTVLGGRRALEDTETGKEHDGCTFAVQGNLTRMERTSGIDAPHPDRSHPRSDTALTISCPYPAGGRAIARENELGGVAYHPSACTICTWSANVQLEPDYFIRYAGHYCSVVAILQFKASAQASIAPAVGIYLLHQHSRHQSLTVGFLSCLRSKASESIRPGRSIVRLRRGSHEERGMVR
ncbi:MAG: hypothetical protein LQ349_001675 [Xanthoria aureola]|nr:MAG: hypothetical protein LQ349_001675 [Xanthoria aureola]